MLTKTSFALSAAVMIAATVVSPSLAQWNWGTGAGVGGTRAQLQAEIDQAYKSGRITEAQSAPLQTRLNEITNLEAQYRATGGRLSRRERADLEQKLDGLAGAIRRELRGGGYGGNNGGGNWKHGKWNWGGGGSGINSTQKQLQAKIDNAYKQGWITEAESVPLQTRLNEIANLESQMRATGNRLSPAERNTLERKLDNLADAIDREINDYDTRWQHKHGRGQGKGHWH